MKKGYLYHIKDEFINRMKDCGLMINKEGKNFRPMYYSFRDSKNQDIFWLIPLSSKIEKYQRIYDEKVAKRGRCDTIVIDKLSDRSNKSVFLIQNMFPITEKYIDHIHTINDVPFLITNTLPNRIDSKAKKMLSIYKNGNKKVLLTKIDKMENILLKELEVDKKIESHNEWLKSNGQVGEKLVLDSENLNGFKFYKCDLRYAEIKNCDLANCVFYADMSNSTFINNKISNTKWTGSDITNMNTDRGTKLSIKSTLENNKDHDRMLEKLKEKNNTNKKENEYCR